MLETFEHPTVMAALRNIENPGRRVPREVMIAFAVGVVREQISERVEIEIVRIPKSVGKNF